ncbi:hypothetical protein MESS4_830196 [Mesorhizobium sp. STM 4661]|nr:hypothetical protein MESS4_830196 [Mesorhizobium sp. STM 4661]
MSTEDTQPATHEKWAHANLVSVIAFTEAVFQIAKMMDAAQLPMG